ncbi:hypothetical protein ACS0TY_011129 [Phlomoides rotata]
MGKQVCRPICISLNKKKKGLGDIGVCQKQHIFDNHLREVVDIDLQMEGKDQVSGVRFRIRALDDVICCPRIVYIASSERYPIPYLPPTKLMEVAGYRKAYRIARWGILKSNSYYLIKTQNCFILGCCLLHNFIRKHMTVDPIEDKVLDLIDDGNDVVEPVDGFIDQVESSQAWIIMRENLAMQIFADYQ